MAGTKILRLLVHNVKGIRDIEIIPGENSLVVIGGRNEQGKTSVLDSIFYALGGKKALPPEPIRKGEDEAEIVLELDDIIITRKMTRKRDSIEVASRDGAKFPSPQAMLDKLVGRLSFDPLAFSRMSGTAAGRREQAQLVRELAGLDFSEIDEKRKAAFDNRTLVNRDLKSADARLKEMPRHEDAPEEEVSVTALAAELEEARSANRTLEGDRVKLAMMVKANNDLAERIAELQATHDQQADQTRALKKKLKGRDEIETATLVAQLEGAEAANRKVRENEDAARVRETLEYLALKASELSDTIEELDKEKVKMVKDAELPVPGLGFGEDGLTLDGLPFEQASSAQQLRTSVAMGAAMNRELRVMLIDQGSELDPDNLDLIGEMAGEQDCQLWLVRVSTGDECTVIMENGKVRG